MRGPKSAIARTLNRKPDGRNYLLAGTDVCGIDLSSS